MEAVYWNLTGSVKTCFSTTSTMLACSINYDAIPVKMKPSILTFYLFGRASYGARKRQVRTFLA